MITLKKNENENIIEFNISGDISAKQVEEFYDNLQSVSGGEKGIKMLGTIVEMPGFASFKTFAQALKIKMAIISKIKKFALLTDAGWMEALMPVSNFVTPGIGIKAFPVADKKAALAWLKNGDNLKYETALSKNIFQLPGTNIFILKLEGEISEYDMSFTYSFFQENKLNTSLRLMIDMVDFTGVKTVEAFVGGIKTDLETIGNISKCAFIANREWTEKLENMENLVTLGMPVKFFIPEDKGRAVKWLSREKYILVTR